MGESSGDGPLPEQRWCWHGRSISYTVLAPPAQAPWTSGESGAERPADSATTPHPEATAVLLIHGFGACWGHWRHNLPVLARHFPTYALDLLGFGSSDKPRSRLTGEADHPDSVRYSFDLWATQVADFAEWITSRAPEGQRPGLQIVGNSIGGVVALRASELLIARGQIPRQVILIDCAQRTLDEKRVSDLPWLQRAGRPLIKRLVRQRWLIAPLFRTLATPGFIRRVLAIAYPSGANVDEALVELLFRPSTDPGAPESFRGFVNLFDDHLAPEILSRLGSLPVRMIWGERDPWENPAEARRWSEQFACIRELRVLSGLGHCPHDEAPELVNPILIDWLGAGQAPPAQRD